ncbi:MAG: prolyl aminopeptidase [Rhodospirillales bacterium]|nr:prolyl aminopeptidase [Rhodospirillales bacterium]
MDIFPPIEPWSSGHLAVGDPHALYWEQCGRKDGSAVLFLHGGPGAGCAPAHRRFFDPGFWRIVLFDQRGAGKSLPLGSVENNTTEHLVADIERLRLHLGIESWLVFGGSWGSTLALAYGQKHPERCVGFILRGVFLFRAHEVDWFLSGMGHFFPEAERAFREFLPPKERHDVLGAYRRRLLDPDPAIHEPAGQAWCAYEDACSRLVPSAQPDTQLTPAGLALARLEAHYMAHRGFVAEGALLDGMGTIRHLPCRIVQGRYDVVCPPATAYELAQAWPRAELVMVAQSGHSSLEPGTSAALVDATEAFKIHT